MYLIFIAFQSASDEAAIEAAIATSSTTAIRNQNTNTNSAKFMRLQRNP